MEQASSAKIQAVLAGNWPASDLMNLVAHRELSFGRADWWFRHTFGTEANLQDRAEDEEHIRYGSDEATSYDNELASLPR